MCLVASSRSPFHKWEDGGWSDSLSSFPAHAGSCLRNSKVFFYLQNLLIPNIAQTVREKQCPEISSVPHSWRFGRNHLRKPSKGSWWASRMLSQVGPSLTTAGGTVTVGGLAGGWVAYVALVNKSLKLLLQRQMLTRAQWTEQACALMWLGMRRNAEKGTKGQRARGPPSPLFPRAAIPGGGLVPWDAGAYLWGRSLRQKSGLK